MAMILALPLIIPRNSLKVLVFFTSLALVDRKLLEVLVTKHVSEKSVSRLIFLKVLLLLFCRAISLESF